MTEDDVHLRKLTHRILARHGYRVLAAPDGVAALDVWEQSGETIHLLLSDIVMPGGLSGRQLADRLRERKPDLPVVFASGYSPEIAGRELSLLPGQNYLQKPALPEAFLETVRRALDA